MRNPEFPKNPGKSQPWFPERLCEAVVSPILKKSSLDKNVLKNYRPVSNISYLSKLLEKLVCAEINDHLASNNLLEEYQSAYRQRHSTETALLCVKADILRALDNNKAVAVVLLDLSSAFDTVDHQIFIETAIQNLSHNWQGAGLDQIVSS